jgi:hypothetical protein
MESKLLDRSFDKKKIKEVSWISTDSYYKIQINLHTINLLFSETVKYCQERVDGVAELEERYC